MTTLNYSHTLVAGANENVNHVQDMFNDARTVINGNLDSTSNFSSGTNTLLGLTDASVRRGKSIIAATETRANAAYGLLTTPDRVSSLVLPTDGIIFILYKALLLAPASVVANAAIFIGANQLKMGVVDGAPTVQEAGSPADASPNYNHLFTGAGVSGGFNTTGLVCSQGATSDSSDVTTGQVIGGNSTGQAGYPITVFAAAGTYDISVQFKSASGTLSVKERKLWVWTTGF